MIAKVKDIINKTVAEVLDMLQRPGVYGEALEEPLLQKLETPQGGLQPRRT